MCSAPGRVSAITPGREISTAQQESLWIDTTDAPRAQSGKCGDFPESANTPRTRWPASRSIELIQSSRLTLLAFWPGFLTFANPSIPLSLGKSFGNTPQFFFRYKVAPGQVNPATLFRNQPRVQVVATTRSLGYQRPSIDAEPTTDRSLTARFDAFVSGALEALR